MSTLTYLAKCLKDLKHKICRKEVRENTFTPQSENNTLRIRLPNDYVVKQPIVTKGKVPSINIDDYSKMLATATNRFAASKLADDLLKKDVFADMLFMGYKPPNRWQKFKCRLKDYKQRCKDIWTIVSGGDVHEDCGY